MTTQATLAAASSRVDEWSLDIGGARRIHRLLRRLYRIQPAQVLNAGCLSSLYPAGRPVAAELFRLAKAMQVAATDPASGRLDYAGLSGSTLVGEYRQATRRLPAFDPASLATDAERLAFWINLYNALIIDAVITFGVTGSVQNDQGFFWRAAYDIGGRRYSAHDIEHGILRANAPHPAIPGAHFAPDDSRRQYSLTRLDPRVHFALVCGARSCPPIAVYDARDIDGQLDLATRSFVNGTGVIINPGTKTIWLSKLFQWYAPDFGAAPLGLGSRQPLLDFVAPYLEGAVSRAVVRTMGWPVRFTAYDWRLNGSTG